MSKTPQLRRLYRWRELEASAVHVAPRGRLHARAPASRTSRRHWRLLRGQSPSQQLALAKRLKCPPADKSQPTRGARP